MRLYRKAIPKIAREIIRSSNAQEHIELEDNKMDEAELDLAAILVSYMNDEEKLVRDTRDVMSRRGMSADRFAQMKKSMADSRGFKTGEDGLDFLLAQLLEGLFASRNIIEIYAEDNDLRLLMKSAIQKFTNVDEEIEREARGRLRNLREGTPEWEIEFPRAVAILKRQKGLI